MQTAQNATLGAKARQEALSDWIRSNETTLTKLALDAGIGVSRLSRMLGQETMPKRHHAFLRSQGIPANFLPRAEDQKRGPKPRPAFIPNAEAMAAFRGA